MSLRLKKAVLTRTTSAVSFAKDLADRATGGGSSPRLAVPPALPRKPEQEEEEEETYSSDSSFEDEHGQLKERRTQRQIKKDEATLARLKATTPMLVNAQGVPATSVSVYWGCICYSWAAPPAPSEAPRPDPNFHYLGFSFDGDTKEVILHRPNTLPDIEVERRFKLKHRPKNAGDVLTALHKAEWGRSRKLFCADGFWQILLDEKNCPLENIKYLAAEMHPLSWRLIPGSTDTLPIILKSREEVRSLVVQPQCHKCKMKMGYGIQCRTCDKNTCLVCDPNAYVSDPSHPDTEYGLRIVLQSHCDRCMKL